MSAKTPNPNAIHAETCINGINSNANSIPTMLRTQCLSQRLNNSCAKKASITTHSYGNLSFIFLASYSNTYYDTYNILCVIIRADRVSIYVEIIRNASTQQWPTPNMTENKKRRKTCNIKLSGVSTLERETGFEPATFGLGSRRSTAELFPHFCLIFVGIAHFCTVFIVGIFKVCLQTVEYYAL